MFKCLKKFIFLNTQISLYQYSNNRYQRKQRALVFKCVKNTKKYLSRFLREIVQTSILAIATSRPNQLIINCQLQFPAIVISQLYILHCFSVLGVNLRFRRKRLLISVCLAHCYSENINGAFLTQWELQCFVATSH